MSDWQSQLSNLVYSTDVGKIEQKTEKPEIIGESFKDGVLRITRQTKGRKGKGVVIIEGLSLPADEFKQVAQKVKKQCGTGGAVKGDVIEIQGDDRGRVKAVLESLGFRCKLAGG